jgi:hypothetical protein
VDAALQELLDARAIEQLMIRDVDRVAAHDPLGAAACFADGLGVGVGTMVPRDTQRDRRHPGHPGRLPVESER